MATCSKPEQSWTKPPQTRGDIARKPFSSWTRRCKKSSKARRTTKSALSNLKKKINFFSVALIAGAAISDWKVVPLIGSRDASGELFFFALVPCFRFLAEGYFDVTTTPTI